MGDLLGVLVEPPTEVVGRGVVVEGAMVAIAEDLKGGLVATSDDETFVITDVEDIEAGLGFALRGVGELEVGGRGLTFGVPGARGLAGKELEGVAPGDIDGDFLCHHCIACQQEE